MSIPIFSEKKWKRPNNDDVPPFPKVWRRLTVRNKNTAETYNLRIQDITPDQYDEAWDLYAEHYYADLYVCRLLNMSDDEESMVSLKLSHYHGLSQNLSIVAVLDNEDTKPTILGCLRLRILSNNEPEPPMHQSLGRAYVGFRSILSWLHEGINLFEKFQTDYLLEELGLVVRREYRGMSIGCELMRTTECIAKAFDILALDVIFLNSISQKIGARLGMTLLKEKKLTDCVDGSGQKVLPTVDPEETCQFGYIKYA